MTICVQQGITCTVYNVWNMHCDCVIMKYVCLIVLKSDVIFFVFSFQSMGSEFLIRSCPT